MTRKKKATGTLEHDELRQAAEAALAAVDAATEEADRLRARAKAAVSEAKTAYRIAHTAYRDACRRAGVDCEFTRGRSENVSPRVSFEVVKVAKGVRVTVRGRPETAEVIPMAKLRVSIGKSAAHYCEKHIGPREVVGNKQGSLANRLRAALRSGGPE